MITSKSKIKLKIDIPFRTRLLSHILAFCNLVSQTGSRFSSKSKKSERLRQEAQKLATLLLLCQSSDCCSAPSNHNTSDLYTVKGLTITYLKNTSLCTPRESFLLSSPRTQCTMRATPQRSINML